MQIYGSEWRENSLFFVPNDRFSCSGNVIEFHWNLFNGIYSGWNRFLVYFTNQAAFNWNCCFFVFCLFFLFFYFHQSSLTNAVKSTLLPEEHIGYKHSQATFLSKITFFWLTPLIWQGYRDPLELDDLGALHETDTCRAQYDRFHFIYKSFKVCMRQHFNATH